MRALGLILCLAFVLTGCMVGPDYVRPKVETPAAWRFEEKEARDFADTAWWEAFGDPVLSELIITGLHENKDLGIAAARVKQARGRYAIARAPLFPVVGASVTAERERASDRDATALSASTKNPADLYQPSLLASWEIDLWGKLRRESEAARAELLASEEGRRAVVLTLVASIADGYVQLLNLDQQLEIARLTAKTREESVRLFTLRFQGGDVSELEVQQARSEYQQVMVTIPAIENAIARQELALNVLVGRNPGPVARGKTLAELGMPHVPSGLPSELLSRRPDIREAEQNLVAANARIGVARAQLFPAITLTGLSGWSSTQLENLFTGPARTWNWGAGLTQPIFAGGALTELVKTSEAVREESVLQYEKAIQNAFRDVEDALVTQRRTREQLEAQEGQVAALRGYARAAKLRYEGGYSSYLEVLDAERNLFSAELNATSLRGQLFQALVNLYQAMGGGWVVVAENKAGHPESTRAKPGEGVE
jgi:multidrug efflux system outer membrane protein